MCPQWSHGIPTCESPHLEERYKEFPRSIQLLRLSTPGSRRCETPPGWIHHFRIAILEAIWYRPGANHPVEFGSFPHSNWDFGGMDDSFQLNQPLGRLESFLPQFSPSILEFWGYPQCRGCPIRSSDQWPHHPHMLLSIASSCHEKNRTADFEY